MTKKEILNQFEAFFIRSGQNKQDREINLQDLEKMSLPRLKKLLINFNL